jgi:hypothetical protein
VQGAVYLIAGTLLIPLFLPQDAARHLLERWIDAIDWARVLVIARSVTWPLAAVLLGTVGVKTWRKWRLVRLAGDPWYYSFDPALRAVSRWNRFRSGELAILDRAIGSFRTRGPSDEALRTLFQPLDTGEHLGQQHDTRLDPGESPVFVLKLPARSHLAVADFVVLRLVREILASGGDVLVVIVDATRFNDEAAKDMQIAVSRTRHFLRRFFGSGITIVSLSDLLLEESQATVHFLLSSPW